MINFRRTFARLFAPARAPPEGLLPFFRVTHDAPGFEDELLLVPVVVVDVGAVEAFDHLGGAGARFDGLEDTEGDEPATVCIVQAVRINDEGGPPARGSLPGGLAATLVRTLSLFRERLVPAYREILRSNQCQQESVVHVLIDQNSAFRLVST